MLYNGEISSFCAVQTLKNMVKRIIFYLIAWLKKAINLNEEFLKKKRKKKELESGSG